MADHREKLAESQIQLLENLDLSAGIFLYESVAVNSFSANHNIYNHEKVELYIVGPQNFDDFEVVAEGEGLYTYLNGDNQLNSYLADEKVHCRRFSIDRSDLGPGLFWIRINGAIYE